MSCIRIYLIGQWLIRCAHFSIHDREGSAIMKEMGFSCVTNANSYHSCAHLPTIQIKQDGFPG
jgi:hypothetical protein